jgi:CubicO group peptidase (beta-lactamase class C family)
MRQGMSAGIRFARAGLAALCLSLGTIALAGDSVPADIARDVARLDDEDLALAGDAALSLGRRGEAAFPALRAALAGGSARQRWGATVALCRSTADIASFVPTLASQLAEPDEALVQASLGALAKLGPQAAPALSALRTLLSLREPDARWAALRVVAAIGPPAEGATADIEPLLRDESAAIRLAAAEAMRSIRPPEALSAKRCAEVTAWLEQQLPVLMRETRVPGVSVALIQRGEVAWARGFGIADVRSGKPVTTETVFEAASMSKPVFALIAMQLVQEGRLDLDRPLVDYLGRDYLPDQPEHRRITARMALTHRTGLVNWREGYAEMGGPLPLAYPPGSEYTYSGEGILFLQRAVEAITGQPLERLAEQRLFAPLGLTRTSFEWTEGIEPDLASGHDADGGFKERTRYRHANAAYSLYTTPSEYAKLLATLRRPERLGERALGRETLGLMLQRELRVDDADAVERPGLARSVATYRALGWSLEVTPEGDILQHSGSNSSGFKAFGQFNPTKDSGLVLFTNGDGGYQLRSAVIARIGDL